MIICQLLLEINKFITITKYVLSLCRNIIMESEPFKIVFKGHVEFSENHDYARGTNYILWHCNYCDSFNKTSLHRPTEGCGSNSESHDYLSAVLKSLYMVHIPWLLMSNNNKILWLLFFLLLLHKVIDAVRVRSFLEALEGSRRRQ